MWEIFLDSLLDSVKLFPFLFFIYLLMEIIEERHESKKSEKFFTGKFAPVFGSVAGIIPECGFSALFAKFYTNGLVTTGTLLAVFLASSDEGLIVLLVNGCATAALALAAIKAAYASVVGLAVNAIYGGREKLAYSQMTDACIECGEEPEGPRRKYLLHPLLHALKIWIYVFAISLIFGALIYAVGEQRIENFLSANVFLQPVCAALVGLIPNCSSSVLLAQGYAVGALDFAGLAAGLSANAGIGLAIIFRSGKRLGNNIFILVSLFVMSALLGYAVMPLGNVF